MISAWEAMIVAIVANASMIRTQVWFGASAYSGFSAASGSLITIAA